MDDISGLSNDELKELYKKKQVEIGKNNNLQMAMKIFLNSGYGAVGNPHFLYFKVDNAEAITLTGQLVNQFTCLRIEKFLQHLTSKDGYKFWVAGDTDSGYFDLNPVVQMGCPNGDVQEKTDFLDKFIKEILDPKIDKISNELADYLNSREQKMVWEREVIAEVAIWTSKKHYVMKVWDDEGLRLKSEPKYKVTGMESIKSSTPGWAREMLDACYRIALERDESRLHEAVEQFKDDFYKLDPSTIAVPRGVNHIEKYTEADGLYKKGAQKHIRSAIIHNWLIEKKGLKIDPITSGSKIKFINLKKPNPINQDVIGFVGYLPKEFELDKYIDREAIWESAFISPLDIMLKVIGWTHEEVNTLL